jgi:DNA-binding transcriptional regulator YiaG
MTDTPPPIDAAFFTRALRGDQWTRLRSGHPTGADIAGFRRALDCTQVVFAERLGISVDTLQNWEQDRSHPDGPAIALLRLVSRHPRLVAELTPA